MPKFRIIGFTVLILCTSLFAFAQKSYLSPDEFQAKLKDYPRPQLLDIRSENDFNTAHIKKAEGLDLTHPDFEKIILSHFNKTIPIFIYCQSGSKSTDASLFLEELGFKNINVLKGGFEKWINSSKPYVSNLNAIKPLGIITEESFKK